MSEPVDIRVRSFDLRDQASCRQLYIDGKIGGRPTEDDVRTDIDDIADAYMKNDGEHFWVAESDEGQIVGMIGVQQHDKQSGRIRRLRVSIDQRRRGIGSALVEAALDFCRRRHYLKVTLDTFLDREPAVRLFEKFGFIHSRTREMAGRELMYFYLDLYKNDERPNREK
jgi:ribosomal protein S18 acetylase RimI-like enzyme